MLEFIARVVVNAVAIAVTAEILPGIHVVDGSFGTYILLGLIFGFVNAVIRPIVMFLTCPAVLLSLGLFIFVINGCMLQLTASLAGDRLQIDSFGWAIGGGIVMAILGMILEGLLGLNRKDESKAKN